MKRIVEVTFIVEVEVDECKFTPEWIDEWRHHFYDFYTVEDHIAHLAQLEARSLLAPAFTEGYGPLADMGIKARVLVDAQGRVSPWCAAKPRAINLKKELWTLQPEACTCARCRAVAGVQLKGKV